MQTLTFPDASPVVAFAADGTLVVSNLYRAGLWTFAPGETEPTAVFEDQKGPVAVHGTLVAMGGYSKVVFLDLTSGDTDVVELGPPYGAVHALTFEPSGERLAVGVGWEVAVIDVAARAGRFLEKDKHRENVLALAWADAHTLVSAGIHPYIHIWDVGAGTRLRRVKAHKETIFALAMHPSGKLVASGGRNGAAELRVVGGKWPLQRSFTTGWHPHAQVWSPDGLRLVSGQYGRRGSDPCDFCIFTLRSGESVVVKTPAGVRDLALSPDGSVLAVALFDGTVQLHDGDALGLTPRDPADDLDAGQHLVRGAFRYKSGTTVKAALTGLGAATPSFDPADVVRTKTELAIDSDGTDLLADVAALEALGTHATVGRVDVLRGGDDPRWVRVHPGGKTEEKLRLPHPAVAFVIGTERFRPGGSISGGIAFSDSGKRAVVGAWAAAHVYDVASGERISRLDGQPRQTMNAVAFAPGSDDIVYTAEAEKLVRWDLATGAVRTRKVKRHFDIAVSADFLALANRTEVTVWDATTLKAVTRLRHPELGRQVCFSPDGADLVTRDDRGRVRRYDVATWTQSDIEPPWDYGSRSVAFLPGTRVLLLARSDYGATSELYAVDLDGGTAPDVPDLPVPLCLHDRRAVEGGTTQHRQVYDVGTGEAGRSHPGSHRGVTWTPDGRLAVCFAAGATHEDDVGHVGEVKGLAFDAAGKRLVSTGYSDGSVRMWDIATGALLHRAWRQHANVHEVVWDADGIRVRVSFVGKGSVLTLDETLQETDKTQASGSIVGGLCAEAYTDTNHTIRHGDRTLAIPVNAKGREGEANDVAVSDGRVAAALSDGRLLVWPSDADVPVVVSSDVDYARAVAWLGDRVLVGGRGRDLHVFDVQGNPVTSIEVGRMVMQIAVRDGRVAVAAYDQCVVIDDLLGTPELRVFHGHPATSVAWSPDGTILAAGSYRGPIVGLRV